MSDSRGQAERVVPPFGADTGWIPIKMKAIQHPADMYVLVVVGGSGAVRSDGDAP
jgi:hypothetical protein